MSDEKDDHVLRLQHAKVRSVLPRSWNAFFGGFSNLRSIQLEAMPIIVSGLNTLVTAPTAGGKTDATVAPICERLLANRWSGLSVLMITPTRALVNDLFERLARPLASLSVGVGRKTSDHAISSSGSEQLLITTPESVESLLTFRKSTLQNVRALILDEIHLLDGTPRGDQLRTLLQRLSRYRNYVSPGADGILQRVAMSATVADPGRIASAFLGDPYQIVSIKGQRDLFSKIILEAAGDDARADSTVAAVESLGDCRKILVFVNSRKQVDAARIFAKRSFARLPVYGHHGSLSKQRREEVEERFKNDDRALCVATMTLEVGIDIGDIDLVVCMDPPFSLSSFLQRIGRGCRRLQGRTRVLCVARTFASQLLFEALVSQSALGIPHGPLIPFRRSVLVQQVLAYLRQADRQQRTRDQILNALTSSCVPSVTGEMIAEILADMTATGLLVERNDIFEPSSSGRTIIESDRIYSNIAPTPAGLSVVDQDTGLTIANIGGVQSVGGGVRVAGRDYQIVSGGERGILRVRGGTGNQGQTPGYHSRSLPYAYDIGASLRLRLGIRLDSIAIVQVPGGNIVFTWLGRLYNTALVAALKRAGTPAKAASFSIELMGCSSSSCIALIQQAAASLVNRSIVEKLLVERLIDLGPFLADLSETQQRNARKDTFDVHFLQAWANALKSLEESHADSSRGCQLLALAEL